MSFFHLIYSETNFESELRINTNQYNPRKKIKKISFCDLCRKIIYNQRKFLLHYKRCQIRYKINLNTNTNETVKTENDFVDDNDGEDDADEEDEEDEDDDEDDEDETANEDAEQNAFDG